MDYNTKMMLCNRAYEAIRKLRKEFKKEGDVDNLRLAANACQSIMFLQISIDEYEREE